MFLYFYNKLINLPTATPIALVYNILSLEFLQNVGPNERTKTNGKTSKLGFETAPTIMTF